MVVKKLGIVTNIGCNLEERVPIFLSFAGQGTLGHPFPRTHAVIGGESKSKRDLVPSDDVFCQSNQDNFQQNLSISVTLTLVT